MLLENGVRMIFNETITGLKCIAFYLEHFSVIYSASMSSNIILDNADEFLGRKSDGASGFFPKDCVEELKGN